MSSEQIPFEMEEATEAAQEVAESFMAAEGSKKPDDKVIAEATAEAEEQAPGASAGASVEVAASPSKRPAARTSNQPKKRTRRVGKFTGKEEEAETPVVKEDSKEAEDAAKVAAAVAEAATESGVSITVEEASNVGRVVTKHDEKWSERYDQLLEYKAKHGNTMVPQCYHEDPRLGRWVHYQRVEYWLYQNSNSAKITKERIARLDTIGFAWDPQKAQWDAMYEKLKTFTKEAGHCRVPKGYVKDPNLANWVRNQRLEEANQKKGKKSRMTEERKGLLTELGFRWSNPLPSRSKNKDKAKKPDEEESKAVKEESNENDADKVDAAEAIQQEGDVEVPVEI
ncbi:MAG: hypothetical protein SGILL_004710 [Bacillariaceae sp.]